MHIIWKSYIKRRINRETSFPFSGSFLKKSQWQGWPKPQLNPGDSLGSSIVGAGAQVIESLPLLNRAHQQESGSEVQQLQFVYVPLWDGSIGRWQLNMLCHNAGLQSCLFKNRVQWMKDMGFPKSSKSKFQVFIATILTHYIATGMFLIDFRELGIGKALQFGGWSWCHWYLKVLCLPLSTELWHMYLL